MRLPKINYATFALLLTVGVGALGHECAVDEKPGEQCKSSVLALHPTQLAVGEREVKEKARSLKKKEEQGALKSFLKSHPAPIVIGPGGTIYLTDHHHLARAVWEAGRAEMFGVVQANLSKLDAGEFWSRMRKSNWVYLEDSSGHLHEPSDLPRDVRGLKDDPFRSLAGAAREAGAFDKSDVSYAEFRWADFFRSRIQIASGEAGFRAALARAVKIAHLPEAKGLPGYRPE